MMTIIPCEVMDKTRYLVCFSVHKITFLMCCSSELSCPMTVISHNNIFVVILQIFTKFFFSLSEYMLLYVQGFSPKLFLIITFRWISVRKSHKSQPLLYFTQV